MYLGVDVGGTKTLVASLDDNGVITEQFRFKTDKDYRQFLAELAADVDKLSTKTFDAACIAIPGLLDRGTGTVIGLTNLPWGRESIVHDCEKIFRCPTLMENDARLAGLSEAMLHKDVKSVLYITVSTGIGVGVVYNQLLDKALLNAEGGRMLVPHNGKLAEWESFASGKAFLKQFGKLGADIPASDEATWKAFSRNLAIGMFELIAVIQPDLIIIGGSMGIHFEKYGKYLKRELDKHQLPIVKIPEIVAAKRPDEAVIYGCYDLARQTYGKIPQPA